MQAAAGDTLFLCHSCGAPLPSEFVNLDGPTPCPNCGAQFQVLLFPALRRPQQAAAPAQTLVEGESTCFYHPAKKAVVPCDHCGRFLCALCDIETAGRHLCPQCLEGGVVSTPASSEIIYYDTIAFWLSLVGLLLLWPSIVTAPAALYYAVRYRKAPRSAARRSGIQWWFAVILSLVQIFLWGALIVLIVLQGF